MKISKRIHKALSFLLSFVLLFQSFAPAVIYAQEVVSEATPAPTQEITPTPTEATPTPEAQILEEAASTDTPSGDLSVTVVPETQTSPPVIPAPLSGEESLSSPTSQTSATLSTDKADYAPTDTAVIGGTNLAPNTTYKLVISSSDDPAVRFETEVTTNDQGSFYYSYKLDGTYRPNYLVELLLGSEIISSTTFTDGPPAVSLEQCRNGSATSPQDCTGSAWQSGNAGSSNSHYVEGFSIPYRAVLENLPVATPITLTLGYDIKHSSKHAIDYLTYYDRLETHTPFGHTAENIDPISGITGVSATTTTFTIPSPSSAGSPVTGQPTTSFNSLPADERVITLFGGTITNISYVNEGALSNSDAETQISVTFTSDNPTGVLSWGGHIGSRLDWGFSGTTPRSAGGISGSPYHMRLIGWSLGNLGNQDRSLSAGAVIPPGNLTIIKNVVPNDQSVWDFTLTGNNLNNTSAQDIPDNGSYAYSLQPGTYTITEASDLNYSTGVSCSTGETGTDSVVVDLASNENIVCTFTNTLNQANLTLVKEVVNNNGGTANATDWTLSATGPTNISGVTGNSSVTNAAVTPGTYILSESGGPSGYSASNYSCIKNGGQAVVGNSIDLATNDSATCTINNDDIQPKLTLVKVVTKDNGGTANVNEFSLSIGGVPVDSGETKTLSANTPYEINEAGLSGYSFVSITGNFKCPTALGGTISLAPGDDITCTITNDDIASSLTLNKIVSNDNGGTQPESAWTLTATGPTTISGPGASGSTDVVSGSTFYAGTYTLSESAGPSGYTASSWTCTGTGSQNGDQITLGLGQTATCTITNDDIAPQLTIVKNVLNPDGINISDSHVFTANVGTISAQISEGNNAVLGINAGIYSVTETDDPDYDELGCKLPNDQEATNFTLNPGQQLTVTCTNKQKKATVTVYKDVLAADGTTDILDNNIFSVTLNNQTKDFSDATPAAFTVNPGNYSAIEDPETNYTFVSNTGPVIVGSNGTAAITITNKQDPASIIGYKYDATSGFGILGWTIYLTGDATATTTTGADGFYQFLGLNVGSYTVSEENRAGWTPTSVTQYDLNLTPGASSSGNNFTNFQNISISGQKFEDEDGDGVKEDGELGLEAWEIYIDTNLNGIWDSGEPKTTTDSSGDYSFTNKGPGTYRIREVQKSGWTQTTSNPLDINAASGQDVTGINFGNFKRVTISGKKFDDRNGDHQYLNTTTDPNLPNWEIQLKDQNGNLLSSVTTNNFGNYSFTNLGPGTYIVREVLQTGWEQTRPNASYGGQGAQADGTYLLTVSSGNDIDDRYFGNFQLGKVSGYKWNDQDGDGTWDQGEPVLPNWTIRVKNYLHDYSEVTDENGYYEFTGLTAGSYTLTEDIQAGWQQTWSPNSLITVTSGLILSGQNFGNQGLATIIVEKDIDPDNEKYFNFNLEGDLIATKNFSLTDNGSKEYTVPVGSYLLSEETDSGYDTVYQCTGEESQEGDSVELSLSLGEVKTCTFTNTKHGSITIIKDTQPDNDQTFDFWTDFSAENDGSFQLVDNGGDDDDNTKTFSDLSGSTYTITEDEPEGWTLSDITCQDIHDDGYAIDGNELTIDLNPGEDVTCTFINTRDTGSVVVNKEVDTDGDGSYDGNNTTANELGFTWSLDGGQATDMGTSISGVETTTEDVSHSVTEDSPDGYHFTGWFTTDGLYSCEEPEGDSLPVDIEVTKDATTSITFCNARDTGTITIDKVTDPAESQDLFTINLTQGETTIHSSVLGDTTNLEPYTVPTGTYSLTELDASNWLLTDAICTDGEISFDPRQTNVVVGYGSDITCTFTNTAANPELTLTKSNNATGDLHPGESVTFTLTLTLTGSNVNDPKVIDLPAKGFKYRPDSFQVTINGLPVTINEPTYASPGTWTLPDLEAGDEVVMTYIADIDSAETPGLYNDLAWAEGDSLLGETVIANANDDYFVGTQVNVVKSNQDSPTMDVVKEEKVEGQVLGATTILPATGADTRWLYLALILGVFGVTSTTAGLLLKRKHD